MSQRSRSFSSSAMTFFATADRKPHWFGADRQGRRSTKRVRCSAALPMPSRRSPLAAADSAIPIAEIARLTIVALEALARDEAGGSDGLYERDAGEKFAGFFRSLIASTADFPARRRRLARRRRGADRRRDRQAGGRQPMAASRSGGRWKRGCRASTRWSSAGSTRAAGRARPNPTASCRA